MQDFIERAKEIFPNYDYSLTNYINSRTKVKIICPKHGEFERIAKDILNHKGCPICGREKSKLNLKHKNKNTETFIRESKEIFQNQFDYSETKYINAKTKIKLKCNYCENSFYQNPHSHLAPRGCPYCKQSTGEQLVRNYLDKYNIKYEIEYKFKACKDKLPLPFDFYLPEKNTVIEIQDTQHYKKRGNETREKFLLRKHHDWLKRKYCRNNNIKLIEITNLKAIYKSLEDLHH